MEMGKEVKLWAKKTVQSLGIQKGEDRMESSGLQEVMARVAVDDMDTYCREDGAGHARWRKSCRVADLTDACCGAGGGGDHGEEDDGDDSEVNRC